MEDSAARRQPKELGPPHLRVVEVDFLKPAAQNASARRMEEVGNLIDGAPMGDRGPSKRRLRMTILIARCKSDF